MCKRDSHREVVSWVGLVVLLSFLGCCGDSGNCPELDTVPPGRITDIHVDSVIARTVHLSWTAPGDDGDIGNCTEYDLRYSTDSMTLMGWTTATQVFADSQCPRPRPTGSRETWQVADLEPGYDYWFAIKAIDEAGNVSAMSNVVSGLIPSVNPQAITLLVYSNGWGTLLDTINLQAEGPVTIDIYEENPYSDPPQYYIYALADGFYTELYYCQKGETIEIDLDAAHGPPSSVTGVVIHKNDFFADVYFAAGEIHVSGPGGELTIVTDAEGRYLLSSVQTGTYTLRLTHLDEDHVFEVQNHTGLDYYDLSFKAGLVVYAPNVYLYPEAETDVSVSVQFPQGGKIIASEPPYNNGWQVHVQPDGRIDDQYDYLFYEASLSSPIQLEEGWLLRGDVLEEEFRSVLSELGFAGREIDDFTDYWVPRLTGALWYAVFPQDVDRLIELNVSPTPQSVLRALFVIRPLQQTITIPEPRVETFERSGFTVVEWGVIGTGDHP